MNELFEFRNHLNIKKTIGIAILALVLIIIIFSLIFNNNNIVEKEDTSNPYKTYMSQDRTVAIELPKRYNLQEIQSSSAMQLKSDDGLFINIEEKPIIFGKSLKEVVTSDKNVYTHKFENAFDVSDLQIFSLDDSNLLTSYKYDFKYINQAVEYYIQVFWIQGNSQYYIINISMPKDNTQKYHGLESELSSSLKFN